MGDAHVWISVVSGVVSSVVGVAALGRLIWRRLVNAVADRLDQLQRTTEMVQRQVTSNGGESHELATRVARIEASVSELLRRLPPEA